MSQYNKDEAKKPLLPDSKQPGGEPSPPPSPKSQEHVKEAPLMGSADQSSSADLSAAHGHPLPPLNPNAFQPLASDSPQPSPKSQRSDSDQELPVSSAPLSSSAYTHLGVDPNLDDSKDGSRPASPSVSRAPSPISQGSGVKGELKIEPLPDFLSDPPPQNAVDAQDLRSPMPDSQVEGASLQIGLASNAVQVHDSRPPSPGSQADVVDAQSSRPPTPDSQGSAESELLVSPAEGEPRYRLVAESPDSSPDSSRRGHPVDKPQQGVGFAGQAVERVDEDLQLGLPGLSATEKQRLVLDLQRSYGTGDDEEKPPQKAKVAHKPTTAFVYTGVDEKGQPQSRYYGEIQNSGKGQCGFLAISCALISDWQTAQGVAERFQTSAQKQAILEMEKIAKELVRLKKYKTNQAFYEQVRNLNLEADPPPKEAWNESFTGFFQAVGSWFISHRTSEADSLLTEMADYFRRRLPAITLESISASLLEGDIVTNSYINRQILPVLILENREAGEDDGFRDPDFRKYAEKWKAAHPKPESKYAEQAADLPIPDQRAIKDLLMQPYPEKGRAIENAGAIQAYYQACILGREPSAAVLTDEQAFIADLAHQRQWQEDFILDALGLNGKEKAALRYYNYNQRYAVKKGGGEILPADHDLLTPENRRAILAMVRQHPKDNRARKSISSWEIVEGVTLAVASPGEIKKGGIKPTALTNSPIAQMAAKKQKWDKTPSSAANVKRGDLSNVTWATISDIDLLVEDTGYAPLIVGGGAGNAEQAASLRSGRPIMPIRMLNGHIVALGDMFSKNKSGQVAGKPEPIYKEHIQHVRLTADSLAGTVPEEEMREVLEAAKLKGSDPKLRQEALTAAKTAAKKILGDFSKRYNAFEEALDKESKESGRRIENSRTAYRDCKATTPEELEADAKLTPAIAAAVLTRLRVKKPENAGEAIAALNAARVKCLHPGSDVIALVDGVFEKAKKENVFLDYAAFCHMLKGENADFGNAMPATLQPLEITAATMIPLVWSNVMVLEGVEKEHVEKLVANIFQKASGSLSYEGFRKALAAEKPGWNKRMPAAPNVTVQSMSELLEQSLIARDDPTDRTLPIVKGILKAPNARNAKYAEFLKSFGDQDAAAAYLSFLPQALQVQGGQTLGQAIESRLEIAERELVELHRQFLRVVGQVQLENRDDEGHDCNEKFLNSLAENLLKKHKYLKKKLEKHSKSPLPSAINFLMLRQKGRKLFVDPRLRKETDLRDSRSVMSVNLDFARPAPKVVERRDSHSVPSRDGSFADQDKLDPFVDVDESKKDNESEKDKAVESKHSKRSDDVKSEAKEAKYESVDAKQHQQRQQAEIEALEGGGGNKSGKPPSERDSLLSAAGRGASSSVSSATGRRITIEEPMNRVESKATDRGRKGSLHSAPEKPAAETKAVTFPIEPKYRRILRAEKSLILRPKAVLAHAWSELTRRYREDIHRHPKLEGADYVNGDLEYCRTVLSSVRFIHPLIESARTDLSESDVLAFFQQAKEFFDKDSEPLLDTVRTLQSIAVAAHDEVMKVNVPPKLWEGLEGALGRLEVQLREARKELVRRENGASRISNERARRFVLAPITKMSRWCDDMEASIRGTRVTMLRALDAQVVVWNKKAHEQVLRAKNDRLGVHEDVIRSMEAIEAALREGDRAVAEAGFDGFEAARIALAAASSDHLDQTQKTQKDERDSVLEDASRRFRGAIDARADAEAARASLEDTDEVTLALSSLSNAKQYQPGQSKPPGLGRRFTNGVRTVANVAYALATGSFITRWMEQWYDSASDGWEEESGWLAGINLGLAAFFYGASRVLTLAGIEQLMAQWYDSASDSWKEQPGVLTVINRGLAAFFYGISRILTVPGEIIYWALVGPIDYPRETLAALGYVAMAAAVFLGAVSGSIPAIALGIVGVGVFLGGSGVGGAIMARLTGGVSGSKGLVREQIGTGVYLHDLPISNTTTLDMINLRVDALSEILSELEDDFEVHNPAIAGLREELDAIKSDVVQELNRVGYHVEKHPERRTAAVVPPGLISRVNQINADVRAAIESVGRSPEVVNGWDVAYNIGKWVALGLLFGGGAVLVGLSGGAALPVLILLAAAGGSGFTAVLVSFKEWFHYKTNAKIQDKATNATGTEEVQFVPAASVDPEGGAKPNTEGIFQKVEGNVRGASVVKIQQKGFFDSGGAYFIHICDPKVDHKSGMDIYVPYGKDSYQQIQVTDDIPEQGKIIILDMPYEKGKPKRQRNLYIKPSGSRYEMSLGEVGLTPVQEQASIPGSPVQEQGLPPRSPEAGVSVKRKKSIDEKDEKSPQADDRKVELLDEKAMPAAALAGAGSPPHSAAISRPAPKTSRPSAPAASVASRSRIPGTTQLMTALPVIKPPAISELAPTAESAGNAIEKGVGQMLAALQQIKKTLEPHIFIAQLQRQLDQWELAFGAENLGWQLARVKQAADKMREVRHEIIETKQPAKYPGFNKGVMERVRNQEVNAKYQYLKHLHAQLNLLQPRIESANSTEERILLGRFGEEIIRKAEQVAEEISVGYKAAPVKNLTTPEALRVIKRYEEGALSTSFKLDEAILVRGLQLQKAATIAEEIRAIKKGGRELSGTQELGYKQLEARIIEDMRVRVTQALESEVAKGAPLDMEAKKPASVKDDARLKEGKVTSAIREEVFKPYIDQAVVVTKARLQEMQDNLPGKNLTAEEHGNLRRIAGEVYSLVRIDVATEAIHVLGANNPAPVTAKKRKFLRSVSQLGNAHNYVRDVRMLKQLHQEIRELSKLGYPAVHRHERVMLLRGLARRLAEYGRKQQLGKDWMNLLKNIEQDVVPSHQRALVEAYKKPPLALSELRLVVRALYDIDSGSQSYLKAEGEYVKERRRRRKKTDLTDLHELFSFEDRVRRAHLLGSDEPFESRKVWHYREALVQRERAKYDVADGAALVTGGLLTPAELQARRPLLRMPAEMIHRPPIPGPLNLPVPSVVHNSVDLRPITPPGIRVASPDLVTLSPGSSSVGVANDRKSERKMELNPDLRPRIPSINPASGDGLSGPSSQGSVGSGVSDSRAASAVSDPPGFKAADDARKAAVDFLFEASGGSGRAPSPGFFSSKEQQEKLQQFIRPMQAYIDSMSRVSGPQEYQGKNRLIRVVLETCKKYVPTAAPDQSLREISRAAVTGDVVLEPLRAAMARANPTPDVINVVIEQLGFVQAVNCDGSNEDERTQMWRDKIMLPGSYDAMIAIAQFCETQERSSPLSDDQRKWVKDKCSELRTVIRKIFPDVKNNAELFAAWEQGLRRINKDPVELPRFIAAAMRAGVGLSQEIVALSDAIYERVEKQRKEKVQKLPAESITEAEQLLTQKPTGEALKALNDKVRGLERLIEEGRITEEADKGRIRKLRDGITALVGGKQVDPEPLGIPVSKIKKVVWEVRGLKAEEKPAEQPVGEPEPGAGAAVSVAPPAEGGDVLVSAPAAESVNKRPPLKRNKKSRADVLAMATEVRAEEPPKEEERSEKPPEQKHIEVRENLEKANKAMGVLLGHVDKNRENIADEKACATVRDQVGKISEWADEAQRKVDVDPGGKKRQGNNDELREIKERAQLILDAVTGLEKAKKLSGESVVISKGSPEHALYQDVASTLRRLREEFLKADADNNPSTAIGDFIGGALSSKEKRDGGLVKKGKPVREKIKAARMQLELLDADLRVIRIKVLDPKVVTKEEAKVKEPPPAPVEPANVQGSPGLPNRPPSPLPLQPGGVMLFSPPSQPRPASPVSGGPPASPQRPPSPKSEAKDNVVAAPPNGASTVVPVPAPVLSPQQGEVAAEGSDTPVTPPFPGSNNGGSL